MKKFSIPVSYTMWGQVEVESESIEKLMDDIRHNRISISLPSPENAEYVDDSFEVDYDGDILDEETSESYWW